MFLDWKPVLFLTSNFCLSPVCPEEMDWSQLYPRFFPGKPSEDKTHQVEFADIGCGYGGLLGDLTFFLIGCGSAVYLLNAQFTSFFVSLPSSSGAVNAFPRHAHAGPRDPSQSLRLCSGPYPVSAGLRTREIPEHSLYP